MAAPNFDGHFVANNRNGRMHFQSENARKSAISYVSKMVKNAWKASALPLSYTRASIHVGGCAAEYNIPPSVIAGLDPAIHAAVANTHT